MFDFWQFIFYSSFGLGLKASQAHVRRPETPPKAERLDITITA
jgi:hypothetical protein